MALPMLLYVKERSKPKNISFEKTFKRIRKESADSFRLLKRYPEFLKFCACGLFYPVSYTHLTLPTTERV